MHLWSRCCSGTWNWSKCQTLATLFVLKESSEGKECAIKCDPISMHWNYLEPLCDIWQCIENIFKWTNNIVLPHTCHKPSPKPFEIPCSNSTASSLLVRREEMTTITLSFNLESTHNQTHNRKEIQQSQEHANLQ